MCSSSSMDREILRCFYHAIRHKLQSKMAHLASLDSARPSIKLYDINTALHKAFILCICIFLRKDFVAIENY